MRSITKLQYGLGDFTQRIDGSELRYNQRMVASLIGRRSTRFPGAQPVTFTRSDLNSKLRTDFVVCEKTDGTRHLLYLGLNQDNHGVPKYKQILIDRKNQYHSISESFSNSLDTGTEQQNGHDLYGGTLLDGELVQQRTSGGQPKLSYLIFDCLALNGNNMMDRAYETRMRSLEICFPSQRKAVYSSSPLDSTHRQLWSLCLLLKTIQPIQALETLLQEDIRSLAFANDGLIFASRNMPYICGTNQNVLKWKQSENLTVDFLVRPGPVKVERVVRKRKGGIEDPRRFYLFVCSGDTGHRYFAPLYVAGSEYDCIERETRESESTILECFIDKQTGLWRPKLRPDGTLLFRRDKSRANHISVVEDILKAIHDTVTEQDLVAFLSGK